MVSNKVTVADLNPQKPPDSPTTARELDFDDGSHDHTASLLQNTVSHTDRPSKLPPPGTEEDVAPPKPPRPVNPLQQAENTLKEAFPSIDPSVVKAVLRASGGNVEPAFNALLGMSDPDAQKDDPAPPPQPPRKPAAPTSTAQSQLAADEQYARQLAEHYNGAAASGPSRGGTRGRPKQYPREPQRTGSRQYDQYDEERERSFIDDDLPVIRDNIKKGFLETQSKVNSWVANLKKKIDGEDEDDFQGRPPPAASGYNTAPSRQQSFGRKSGDYPRRSADHDRYDADPQVLSNDFTDLHLKDHEATGPPRRSNRPLANPDLFKPTPPRPETNSGRRVSFQDGPPAEIGVQQRPTSPPNLTKSPSSGASGKSSKWQPLASIEPSPVADHDPFSLGDSDDEDTKKKDVKADDNERLKQAAAGAPADDVELPAVKKLESHDRTSHTGVRDHEAEKLTGKPAI
ncbi:MAG: hypothetical protein LQ352_002308 [Teloschistes flavicans]|nr:MAG: hypothetical protein LQ352_002308 [Teloschistes flavicans]